MELNKTILLKNRKLRILIIHIVYVLLINQISNFTKISFGFCFTEQASKVTIFVCLQENRCQITIKFILLFEICRLLP